MEIAHSSDGLRRLTLELHDDIELKRRLAMRKTNPVTNPQAMLFKTGVETMQKVSYEKFGEEYPDSKEMEGLRQENAALRKKLDSLGSKHDIPKTMTKRDATFDKVVDVVVKFSIEKKATVDHKQYSTLQAMRTGE